MIGFLNIDKPQVLTSHGVVARVRRVAGMKKVGHAGTLDPLATGVLVVGLGRATRLIEYIMGRPKIYQTTVRLGQTTDTYDADGDVVQERPVAVSDEQLADALQPFRGEIEQVPPMYSAIKRQGQPLYKLARQGIEVERAARRINVYALDVIERQGDAVTLEVACSTGTYIRSLAHDLGESLGCGGHVTMLRRTRIGELESGGLGFSAETATPLDALTPENIQSHLFSVETAIGHLPRVDLTDEMAKLLKFGKQIELVEEFSAEIIAAFHNDK
ncbi:MAG: tRNA pseudouridine(55) synthase TruB, partial [Candidatus Promineifilaceae bacterium]